LYFIIEKKELIIRSKFIKRKSLLKLEKRSSFKKRLAIFKKIPTGFIATFKLGLVVLFFISIAGLLALSGSESSIADGPGSELFIGGDIAGDLANKPKVDSTRNQIIDVADEYDTADVTSRMASVTGTLTANNLLNEKDSLYINKTIASVSGDIVTTTQTTLNLASAREIKKHIVTEGETIPKIADKYGLKADSIRWSNDMVGDAVAVGKELLIPPTDGLIISSKTGVKASNLAKDYKADEGQIIAYNDLPADGVLKKDQLIIIPNGTKPTPQTVAVPKATATTTNTAFASNPVYGGNRYSYGYCTWHSANRRAAIGRAVPNNWGNALTWASIARSQGFSVDGVPRAGDVIWYKNIGGAGHVGYVEGVNADGSILVSEMNNSGLVGGGWNRIGYWNVPTSRFGEFLFIH
jgi:surface antigen